MTQNGNKQYEIGFPVLITRSKPHQPPILILSKEHGSKLLNGGYNNIIVIPYHYPIAGFQAGNLFVE